MLIVKTIEELGSYLKTQQNLNIALVPTMGALHQGHGSLIKRAVIENEITVVSIFVNPLQFSPTEDLTTYPRNLETDCNYCQELGVDIIFAPTRSSLRIIGDTDSQKLTTTVIPPQEMTDRLCGKYRHQHFTGVATIVTKLLNIVRPDRAYFGQKDAQQLAIIRRLVIDLNIPVEIIGCPIIRESSGLALSSRNQYLSQIEKEKASILYRSLQQASIAFRGGENRATELIKTIELSLASEPKIKLEYIEIVDPDTLQSLDKIEKRGLIALAAYLGNTRLIDNIILRKPIIAIDGPAGSGKSSVTRAVAEKLGLLYLDTGAMYRAVTWLVMDSSINLDDETAIANLISGKVNIELIPGESPDIPTSVYINGKDVTTVIRTPDVTANVSTISAQLAVRQELVSIQKNYGKQGGIIAEGRDIGTHVFPDADLKIYLTASVEERARRRKLDLEKQGIKVNIDRLKEDIQERDRKDSNRTHAPLKKAEDAIELITDGLTIEEVINKIIELFSETPNYY